MVMKRTTVSRRHWFALPLATVLLLLGVLLAAGPTQASASQEVTPQPTQEVEPVEETTPNDEVVVEAQGDEGATVAQEPTDQEQAVQVQDTDTQATNDGIVVNVGLPSEANMYKDVYAQCTYSDNFFANKAGTYNDDLAYASVCLASAADNSNEEGTDYGRKLRGQGQEHQVLPAADWLQGRVGKRRLQLQARHQVQHWRGHRIQGHHG